MTRQTTIVAEGLCFGEGPRWHDDRLWFSDFYDHSIKSIDSDGQVRIELALVPPSQPSGLGWLPDGRLVFTDMLARRVLRREHDGRLVVHGDISTIATWHCNDLVVDAFGRVFVGNFGFDLETFSTEMAGGTTPTIEATNATIARIDPDGTVSPAAADIGFPNGTVITPDHRTMLVAESMAARLTAFTLQPDGSLTDRRVWAELPGVAPDGICMDTAGRVWVANARAPEVILVVDGEIVERVTTSQNAYACMLGGADGRTLFVMTAGSSHSKTATSDRSGRIETLEVDVGPGGWPGMPVGFFRLQQRGHTGDLCPDPDGFVHLTMGSPAVTTTANRHYRNDAGEFDVIHVDARQLDAAKLRFEPTPDGMFPHYYGIIPASAIETRSPIRRYADGSFTR